MSATAWVEGQTSSLYACCRSCSKSFEILLSSLSKPNDDSFDVALIATVKDEYGRFKVWTGNIGALQLPSLKSSLDHRLREASNIRAHLMKTLDYLNKSLGEG